jgi:hypothetical protein
MASLVELIHTHTGSTKALGCTSWRGEAINLAGEGMLVCRGKFDFIPLDYGAIQLHLELDNFFKYDIFDTPCIFQLIDVAVDSFNTTMAKDGIVLNFGGLDGPDSLPAYLENGTCNCGTWHSHLSSRV